MKDDEELAFPCTDARGFVSTGMTLRDWFAGQAIMGLCACPSLSIPMEADWREFLSDQAFKVADAMMEARRKCT